MTEMPPLTDPADAPEGVERFVFRYRVGGGHDHEYILDVVEDDQGRQVVTHSYRWIGVVPPPSTEDIEEGRVFVPPTYPEPVTWRFADLRAVLRWVAYEACSRPEYTLYGPPRILPDNWNAGNPGPLSGSGEEVAL